MGLQRIIQNGIFKIKKNKLFKFLTLSSLNIIGVCEENGKRPNSTEKKKKSQIFHHNVITTNALLFQLQLCKNIYEHILVDNINPLLFHDKCRAHNSKMMLYFRIHLLLTCHFSNYINKRHNNQRTFYLHVLMREWGKCRLFNRHPTFRFCSDFYSMH